MILMRPFDTEKLTQLVQKIVMTVNPERIVLFGSRARGDYRPDSDLDLLIIQKSSLPRYRRAAPIRHAISGLFPSKDIVVYTPEEVLEWEDVPNAFVTTALSEGKVLYEKKSQ